MHVRQPIEVTDELRALWDQARKRLSSHRGGPELFATICGDVNEDALLAHVVTGSQVWTISDDERILGFALVRDEVVEALFVDHDHRRRRVASSLLRALVDGDSPPRDGYALPGDRGMKSLYESFGWKARLLTMRGE